MVEVEPWALRQLVAESPDRLRQKLLTHARYEHIWEQANRGWLRSLKDSVTQKDKSDKDGSSKETITKGQAGDPAFLAQMNGALKGIRELWGLDDPVKKDVSGTIDVNHDYGGTITIEQRRSELLGIIAELQTSDGGETRSNSIPDDGQGAFAGDSQAISPPAAD